MKHHPDRPQCHTVTPAEQLAYLAGRLDGIRLALALLKTYAPRHTATQLLTQRLRQAEHDYAGYNRHE